MQGYPFLVVLHQLARWRVFSYQLPVPRVFDTTASQEGTAALKTRPASQQSLPYISRGAVQERVTLYNEQQK